MHQEFCPISWSWKTGPWSNDLVGGGRKKSGEEVDPIIDCEESMNESEDITTDNDRLFMATFHCTKVKAVIRANK